MDDFPFYAGGLLTASLYAITLEKIGRENYEPDWTVVTVMIGVALTGGWVALRIAYAPLPALAGAALAWWVWWLMFWMFVATGTPITLWQVWQSRQRLADMVSYLLRERHGHEADPAAAVPAARGGAPEAAD
jgi:hypothetical protein